MTIRLRQRRPCQRRPARHCHPQLHRSPMARLKTKTFCPHRPARLMLPNQASISPKSAVIKDSLAFTYLMTNPRRHLTYQHGPSPVPSPNSAYNGINIDAASRTFSAAPNDSLTIRFRQRLPTACHPHFNHHHRYQRRSPSSSPVPSPNQKINVINERHQHRCRLNSVSSAAPPILTIPITR